MGKKNHLDIQQVLVCLSSMRTQCLNRLKVPNEYNQVLSLFIDKLEGAKHFFAEPLIKAIADESKLAAPDVEALLLKAHEDIIDGSVSIELRDVTSYTFVLENLKNEVMTFTVTNLRVLPHIGDQIMVPYFKAVFGTELFYVDYILHKFNDNAVEVMIDLRPGNFNPYWYFKREQALFEGVLSDNDMEYKNDRELIMQLKKMGKI